MTQTQLNLAIARVTGESLGTIRQRGFSRLHRPRRTNRPSSPRQQRPSGTHAVLSDTPMLSVRSK